jgi:hypothetical protein
MNTTRRIKIPDNSLDYRPLTPNDTDWHKDDAHPSCELCDKKFTFFNRRHHCRNCGKVICDDCSMAQYTHENQNPYSPYMVCKLCKYCVFSEQKKDSKECKEYMKDAKFVDDSVKQFIADDFTIGGKPVTPGSILTMENVGSGNFRENGPVVYEAIVDSLDGSDGKINMILTNRSDRLNFEKKPDVKDYLKNIDDRSSDEKSRIHIFIHDEPSVSWEPSRTLVVDRGNVYVTSVTPPAQDGGYKYRKNKSKRKNKRSVKRRMSNKRSNICRKNKKVTKRLRKSRRRARL